MNILYLMGGAFKDYKLIFDDIKSEKQIDSILFIDEANKTHRENLFRFVSEWQKLSQNIVLFNDEMNLQEEIEKADLIYISGGMTERLVEFAIKNNLKRILSDIDDKILVGLSAGAIMFFKYGYGDKNMYQSGSDFYGFDFTVGLDIYNYIFCPHYQKQGILSFNQDIKKYDLSGFAFTNGALLKIQGNTYYIIKEKGAQAVYLDKNKDYQLIPLKENQTYEFKA